MFAIMNFYLPTKVNISGNEEPVRTDFRVILEILTMLKDPELSNSEKAYALLYMFYENPEEITDYEEAIKACFEFIDGNGSEKKKSGPQLVDWEQDFDYIVAPVNRVLGKEIRSEQDLHWWTFLSAYMEIGPDCLFSQIVNIRDKKARGKKLEKQESEWYRRNREIVDIKHKYTDAEDELIKQWKGGVSNG